MKVHINALSSDAEPEKSIRIRYEADLIATHHEFTHNKDTLEHVKAASLVLPSMRHKLPGVTGDLLDFADEAVRCDAEERQESCGCRTRWRFSAGELSVTSATADAALADSVSVIG